MNEQQNQNVLAAINKATNDYNSLKIRFSTEELLEKFEQHLRGEKKIFFMEEGELKEAKQKIGEPLCNEKGIQNIMRWINNIINTQTVQGNFPVDKHGYSFAYEEEIREFREEFGYDLVLNIYEWNIQDEEAEGIIDMACSLVRIFLSRLIGNEERKSYGETMRTIESNVSSIKGGGMNPFKAK